MELLVGDHRKVFFLRLNTIYSVNVKKYENNMPGSAHRPRTVSSRRRLRTWWPQINASQVPEFDYIGVRFRMHADLCLNLVCAAAASAKWSVASMLRLFCEGRRLINSQKTKL